MDLAGSGICAAAYSPANSGVSNPRLAGEDRGSNVTASRKDHGPVARFLFVGIVVLSVIHVPLPQADFHNVRHHDAPGEVCLHHDHLLRWHPSADFDADLSLLHWHWFLPLVELGDHHERPDDDHHRPGSGPALHAHVGDGLVPNDWRGEPVIQPAGAWRLIDQLELSTALVNAHDLSAALAIALPSHNLFGRAGPAGGLRAERAAMFQRWNC
jgi:hypothetical protein